MKKLLLCLMALLLGVPLTQSKVFYIDLIDGRSADNLYLWIWGGSSNLLSTWDSEDNSLTKLVANKDAVKDEYKTNTSFTQEGTHYTITVPDAMNELCFRNSTGKHKLSDNDIQNRKFNDGDTFKVSTNSYTYVPVSAKYYLTGWDNTSSNQVYNYVMETTDENTYTLKNVILNASKGNKVNKGTNGGVWLGFDKLSDNSKTYFVTFSDDKNFKVKDDYAAKKFNVTYTVNGNIEITLADEIEITLADEPVTDFWVCGEDFGWKNDSNPTEGAYKKDENKFVKNGNIWTKTVSLTGEKYWGIMDSRGRQWEEKERVNKDQPETWSELLTNHKLVNTTDAMKAAATGEYDLTIKLDTDGTPLLTIAKHVDGPAFYVVGDQFAVEKDEHGTITKWLTSDKYKLNQEGSTWTGTIHVNKGFNWAIRDNSGNQWAITADNTGEWAEDFANHALVANEGGNKAGGTGQYKLTLTVGSDNTPSIAITKLDRPAPAEGTVFFVFSQTCPDGLNPDNIRCYTYDNTTSDPKEENGELNHAWPGLPMEEDYIVADLLNEGVTDIKGLIRVFKYTNPNPNKQKMVIFNNNDQKIQTRNLLYVNYGVYSFNNELTPTNILMYGANGTSRLRRYANTEDPKTAKYLYVPIEEFGFDSKDTNSVNAAKETTAYIHITVPGGQLDGHPEDWVITGIKGTSKMILAEYAGQYFWRFPSASIKPGNRLDIEINVMDGADKGKWKNICKHGDANQTEENSTVSDHYNCGGPANRIMHIPANAGEDYIYKRGIVYYRYKSNHDPLTTTIYDLTKPKALYLVDATNNKEYLATRFDENGVFYWDGDDQKISKSEGTHQFYFRAEFDSNTSPTLYYRHDVPNVDGVLNTRRLMHYEIDHIDVVPTAKFFDVPQNETFDTYRVRLSWSDQDFWTNPVDEDPIISIDAKDFVAHTLDSNESEAIGVTLHGAFKDEQMLWMTEASIEMTPEYVAMSPKTAAAHKPVAIKCTNKEHPKAHLTWADGWNVDNSEDAKLQKAQVNVRAYVAGKYNVSIINPASALFPKQVFSKEITVKPTTQALGLMIHDHPITTITDGVCTLNYNPNQLYEQKENGEYDKTKPLPNKPHEGQPQGIVWGPTKAFMYCTNVDWKEQENIEIWYSVSGAANAALDLDNEPLCRPTAEDAVPASKIDGSYQKYDHNHSLNLFDLIDKGQSASIIVKQNGIESEPLTLNFSNISTAVDQIEEAEDDEPIYYTLQGVRVENPDKGIYIRIRGKKADKVMF